MLQHCGANTLPIGPRPIDGLSQPIAQSRRGNEFEMLTCFVGRTESAARAVPVSRGSECDRRRVAGQFVNQVRQVEDRRLDPRGEVINLTWLPADRAPDEAAGDVVDEDEVARCDAAIFDWQ